MSIRKIDSQVTVARTGQTEAAIAPRQAEVKNVAVRTAPELDAAAAAKLQGAAKGHTVLPSFEAGAAAQPSKTGPLSLKSATAQDAIRKSLEFLGRSESVSGAGVAFEAQSVERDALGMVHVRLNKEFHGIPVFGEQIVSHLDANGNVVHVNGDDATDVPESLTREARFTAEQALMTAAGQFEGKAVSEEVETVITRNADGEYVLAYHARLINRDASNPRDMHYLIDANTGKVLESWNQIDVLIHEHDLKRLEALKAKALGGPDVMPVTEPKEYAAEDVTPGAIEDLATVERALTLTGDENYTVDNVKLSVDIDHTWPGDVTVSLTSPSGKSVNLWDRKPGPLTDLEATIDLADFNGEAVTGDWKLTVTDAAGRDVGTLNQWSLVVAASDKTTPPPPDTKDDTSMYSGPVEIGATEQADGTWKLEDQNRGKGVITRDANNASSSRGAKDIYDNNNVWGEEGDSDRNDAAVDAQYGGQMTYDFYKDILGRDSIDGQGEALISNVHIRRNYVNAYWDGQQMHYGDGDGRNASALTSLDIAGHEISHGLTERTAGLIYSGESGGMNEAMSDILGKGVEWYAAQQNPNVKFTWGVGERVWTPGVEGDALRYMNDPTADDYSVDHYSNYPKQTEVHGSSGIANNAFYLLVNGGTNRTSGIEVKDGIGMEKGLKIFGRALINYMTPRTTFSQARAATIQAATDLYGADSVEVAKLKEAWTAVGVE